MKTSGSSVKENACDASPAPADSHVVYLADPVAKTLTRVELPLDEHGADLDSSCLRILLNARGSLTYSRLQLKPFRDGSLWWAVSDDMSLGLLWEAKLPRGLPVSIRGEAVLARHVESTDETSRIVPGPGHLSLTSIAGSLGFTLVG